MDDKKVQSGKTIAPADTTPRVTGIGGIFFFSENPKETRAWYQKNLGIEVSEWGAVFEARDVNDPDEVHSMAWTPFKKGSDYFSPSTKEFMINYRVQNMEGLVAKLRENGVNVLDDIAASEYGKFVHVMDADGNKIELWEAADDRGGK